MNDRPQDIVFRVRASELEALLKELQAEPGLEPLVSRSAGATGGGEFVSVLVPLVPAVLAFIAAIATTWIKKPGATVELKNMKVTGVSRRTVEALLRRELDIPPKSSASLPKAGKKKSQAKKSQAKKTQAKKTKKS
jgi:hypothetical protein